MFLNREVVMAYCPNCGESLDEIWEYCPSCGHQLLMKCPNCQADLSPGSRFCPKCGNPVIMSKPFETSSPLVSNQESKRDDMWILLILGIIFIVGGLVFGICFFLGILLIVLYVILEFSRKSIKK
jgi:predicted amidophosphoribosyltransferase